MSSCKLILALFIAIVAIMSIQEVAAASPANVCSASENAVMPCTCCKKACWFSIAEMATDYFGHMPGEKSDAETKFALGLMRECIKTECSDVCPSQQ